MDTVAPDDSRLKARLKATWMAGDFGRLARTIESHAEEFIARRSIQPGQCVLDIACGTGNLAIPAAKAGGIVSGMDIATNLIEQARVRAAEQGLAIAFDEGDAEQLAYPDAAFDLVVSMYGVMFAPHPERATAEMLRVCRPGGCIAMANWTPGGFTGQMFKLTSEYVAPPHGLPAPVLWGDEVTVRQRLADGVSALTLSPVRVAFRFPFGVAEVVEFYRNWFGPTQRAFALLSPERQVDYRRDLEALWSRHNRATDGGTDVETEYLEVVAIRA